MANILMVTFDLSFSKLRLMPWRTILEVSEGLRKKGHEVTILSISGQRDNDQFNSDDNIVFVYRDRTENMRHQLSNVLNERQFDATFLPVSWSQNSLIRKMFSDARGIKIAYLPGSVFELSQIVPVIGKMPITQIFPYLVQAVFPTFLFTRSLKSLKAQAIITNSEYTRRRIPDVNSIPVTAIGPGRDQLETTSDSLKDARSYSGGQDKYILFMGPPLPIRGIFILLDAFMTVADDPNMLPLLCLFRSDEHLDLPILREKIESKWSHPKLHFVWKSLEPHDLNKHIQNSCAVCMPFLIVPSEIPLAVYEAAGNGKNVVTTRHHGTGEFVSQFGKTVPAGNVKLLAETLLNMSLTKDKECSRINKEAKGAYQKIEDWPSVANRWESVMESILKPT